MVKKAALKYDGEEDILYVFSGEKAKDSIQFDRFVFDFSSDNKVVGIEIQGASEYIKEMIPDADIKDFVCNVKEIKIAMIQSKDLIYAVIKVEYLDGEMKSLPAILPERVMARI